MFHSSRSDALRHKQTGSSLQHLGFRGYLKYHIDYFVIQLLSELLKSLFLSVQLGLFSNWMSSKHYFKAYFVKKQAKRKIPIFDQIHGLTPFKKSPQGDLVKSLFFQSSQACFLTRWAANIISRRILLKSTQREKFLFLTKIMG